MIFIIIIWCCFSVWLLGGWLGGGGGWEVGNAAMNCVTLNYACGYVLICDAKHILQSEFIENGFKKTENFEHRGDC